MRISFITFLMICFVFTAVSCENDSEKDLVDVEPVNLVTYDGNVKSIIDSNCIACHNDPPVNFAPMPLLTFENVKDAIENRGLLNRISSEDPTFLMPFGGQRLPQATIDIVTKWRDDGLLEK